MNKKLSAVLILFAVVISGCGKNNSNNTTTPSIPPVNGNPIYSNPVGSTLDMETLRKTFEEVSLAQGVTVGDYYDEVTTSLWGFNYSINLFGQDIASNSSFKPKRYKVVSADANFVDLEEEGKSSNRPIIDRSKLIDRVFSDNRTDYRIIPSRGCIFTSEYGVIQATVLTKEKEYMGWYGSRYWAKVERVVVAPSIPLFLNPISVETQTRSTFIRRFKVGSKVTNIVRVGPCY